MSKKTQDPAETLWSRCSYPVQSAWLTFAAPEQQAQWRDLQGQFAFDAFVETAKSNADSELSPSEKLLKAAEASRAIAEPRLKLKNHLQATLQQLAAQGHVIGYGFETPRSLSDKPVELPNRVWSGTVNWDKGSLQWQGLELVEVRLTTLSIRNEVMSREQVAKPTNARAAGRPNLGPEIKAAFDALNATGEIDATKPAKPHYDKVRLWLERNRRDMTPPPAKLSDEGIRFHFMPLFKALKESRKQ